MTNFSNNITSVPTQTHFKNGILLRLHQQIIFSVGTRALNKRTERVYAVQ